MINKIILCLLVTIHAGAAPAAAESAGTDVSAASPLEMLKAHLDDQAEFERRIRAFEKLYLGMARAKHAEAGQFEEQGEAEKAKAAANEARELLLLVKSAYELGLSRFDSSAMLNNFYGELLHDFFGRPNEAAKHWQRAVQLDKKYARAFNNLGMYHTHIGMYATGLDHLERSLKLEPKNPDYLFNMVQVYLTNYVQIGQIKKWDHARIYRDAMKMSERAASLQPNDFELLRDHAMNFFLAEKFKVNADWRKAARAWQLAQEHARNEAEKFNCKLNEARVHIRGGDKEKARACLEQAEAIMPGSPVVQNLLNSLAD